MKPAKRNSVEAIKKRTIKEIRHGRHCVFMMHVHLVFVPKYRKQVFTKEILEDMKGVFEAVCIDFNAELKEFNGEKDHVHLLVNYEPKVTLSRLVGSLKGVSARMLRQKEYPNILKHLWGDQLWSPSYFAGSCGGGSLDVVRKYIEKQTTPV